MKLSAKAIEISKAVFWTIIIPLSFFLCYVTNFVEPPPEGEVQPEKEVEEEAKNPESDSLSSNGEDNGSRWKELWELEEANSAQIGHILATLGQLEDGQEEVKESLKGLSEVQNSQGESILRLSQNVNGVREDLYLELQELQMKIQDVDENSRSELAFLSDGLAHLAGRLESLNRSQSEEVRGLSDKLGSSVELLRGEIRQVSEKIDAGQPLLKEEVQRLSSLVEELKVNLSGTKEVEEELWEQEGYGSSEEFEAHMSKPPGHEDHEDQRKDIVVYHPEKGGFIIRQIWTREMTTGHFTFYREDIGEWWIWPKEEGYVVHFINEN